DIEIPKRVQYMRVIVMELARIADHIICNGILGVDTGAFSGFLYVMQEREFIYEIYEEICGARLTDRKSTRLNSSHVKSSYALFCLKKKKKEEDKKRKDT